MLLLSCSTTKQTSSAKKINFNPGAAIAQVYTTAQNTDLRLTPAGTKPLEPFQQPLETQPCIFVDPAQQFQEFVGIGAALTDASAETFAKLPQRSQDEFMKAYFDKTNGIGYTLARTNMNSCDFSSGSYTYVNENDGGLTSFNIEHDKQFKLPFIKEAQKATGNILTFYVSPWSPPAWMKDNNNMLQGGKLLPKYFDAWANYYVKFIKAYEAEGVPVWGLSVQNEPMAKQRWESCIYTADEERDFIKNHLGPTLHKNGLKDKKLIAWDHNRDLIFHRANTILSDKDAARFVWGVGFHWYETWTGSEMQFGNVKMVNDLFPDKNLIFTEGCVEAFKWERLLDWALGERYGWSMINDFNSGTVAWTDWNILLDERGGPNHVGNFCFAPVIADTRDGSLHYTNSYYYIGHFSKFIKPGARRVAAISNRDKLSTTAFVNTDGSLAVVVMNRTGDTIGYKLSVGSKAAELESLPHSISTVVIK